MGTCRLRRRGLPEAGQFSFEEGASRSEFPWMTDPQSGKRFRSVPLAVQ
jgi:hypothetical protein